MKPEIKPVNKRISTYRKLAGYTQQTASDALGIKKNTYARMERHGNPTPDMLIRLAQLYNVSPNQILFGTPAAAKQDNNTQNETARLHEESHIFKKNPDIVLTTNEKNCIKVCRKLTKQQQKDIMALINRFYNESKENS